MGIKFKFRKKEFIVIASLSSFYRYTIVSFHIRSADREHAVVKKGTNIHDPASVKLVKIW